MEKLTNKQNRFIEEYLIDLNATQAAIRAGYSKNTARQIGHRLLTNVNIESKIESELKKIHEGQSKTLLIASKIAIKALIDVVENGSWSARVSAANSILDRSGHKATDKFMERSNSNKSAEWEEYVKARDQLLRRLSNDES